MRNTITNYELRITNCAPRGSIMIIAVGVIVVLASLVLVYSQEMRIEAQAASNRASQLQAAGAQRARRLPMPITICSMTPIRWRSIPR